jgi:diguanylate cyclase (GGDEF)-like protein
MLTGSGHEDAVRVARRLLDAVAKNKEAETVTVSLGVAAYPEMAATAEELIYRADMALNWAKSSGKNRVGDWHALIARKDGELPAPAENAVDAGIASS